MKRRQFIGFAGGVAAWPLSLRAQQLATPWVGFLHSGSRSPPHAGLMTGLSETGYVDGRNVAIEFRYAEGNYHQLQSMATDLVQRQVSVLVAAASAAAAACGEGRDRNHSDRHCYWQRPRQIWLGCEPQLPGANVTGISFFAAELEAKRLGLLHELAPRLTVAAALVNPRNANAESQSTELNAAARTLGLRFHILEASSELDFEAAFAKLVQNRASTLVVASDPFFFGRRQQLVALAARHAVPTIYEWREFAEAGGLASYGTNLTESYRQAGIYTRRILKGEKPADLPVVRATKFELVINLKAAKVLGLTVPPTLLARADEVIE